MTSSAPALPLGSVSKTGFGRFGKGAAVIALALGLVLLFSTWIHLEIPQLTGRHTEAARILYGPT